MHPIFKLKAAFFLAAAGLSAAQDLRGQPQCALECLQEYIPKAGCELDDTACQCASEFQKKLQTLVTPCLIEACEIEDLVKAQQAASEACEAFASTADETVTSAPATTFSSTTTRIKTSTDRRSTSVSTSSSTIEERLASSGSNSSLVAKTEGSPTPTATTGTESVENGGDQSSKAWIAGPVVGGIVGLALLACAAYFFKRKRGKQGNFGDVGALHSKPELHSESAPRRTYGGRENEAIYEIQSTFPQAAEMAANEIPAAELPSGNIR